MPPPTTHFIQVTDNGKISEVLGAHAQWVQVFFKNANQQIPITGLLQSTKEFQIKATEALPPGHGSLQFQWGPMNFYLDGQLQQVGDQFLFTHVNLYQEQKRKASRMAVPLGYPGYFSIKKINQIEVDIEAPLADIHGDGLQFIYSSQPPIQSGDHISGTVHLNKFPEVQLAGHVRHCAIKVDSNAIGVELAHLEFGSENALRELLLFFRHDVFNFNKKKASSP